MLYKLYESVLEFTDFYQINTKLHHFERYKLHFLYEINHHVTCYKYYGMFPLSARTFNCEKLDYFREINAKITVLNDMHITELFH